MPSIQLKYIYCTHSKNRMYQKIPRDVYTLEKLFWKILFSFNTRY